MPTITVRPTRIDSSGGVSAVGGTLLNVIADDSDATYARITAVLGGFTPGFDLSLPAGSSITEVALRVRANIESSGGSQHLLIGLNGAEFPQTLTTSIAEYAQTVFLAAADTEAEINSVDKWRCAANVSTPVSRVHAVYLDVTYTEGPGVGFLPVGF